MKLHYSMCILNTLLIYNSHINIVFIQFLLQEKFEIQEVFKRWDKKFDISIMVLYHMKGSRQDVLAKLSIKMRTRRKELALLRLKAKICLVILLWLFRFAGHRVFT